MDQVLAPDMISHEALFVALEGRSQEDCSHLHSVYEMQLKHSLLSLARKARLEVAAHRSSGLSAAELHAKSTAELLILIDQQRGRIPPGSSELLRYW